MATMFAPAALIDTRGAPHTFPQHLVVHKVTRSKSHRASSDKAFVAQILGNANGADELKANALTRPLGITQDSVVKGQHHFSTAIAGISTLCVHEKDKDKFKTGSMVGDGNIIIGTALDAPRFDPQYDSLVIDVHICHSNQILTRPSAKHREITQTAMGGAPAPASKAKSSRPRVKKPRTTREKGLRTLGGI